MKRFKTELLLENLKKDVERLLECAGALQRESDLLLEQPAPGKWSIAQILEHLNSYGHHYLPTINRVITTHTDMQRQAWYNPGLLGNYFTKVMKPTSVLEVNNKMKTQKNHAPDNNLDAAAVLKEFTRQQQELIQLLEQAKTVDLAALRIPITVSKFVKLKLGDAFRFLIAHEQRHMIQARNTLQALGCFTGRFPVVLPEAEQ